MYLTLEEAHQIDNRITSEHIALASGIIDQHCDKTFAPRQFTERVELKSTNRRLTHLPVVNIVSVRGLMRSWELATHFGEQWTDVDASNVHIDNRGEIFMPPTVWNTEYDAAEITYEAGWTEAPANVKRACAILATQLVGTNTATSHAYQLSALITPEVADLLSNFRERRSPLV